MLRTIEEVLGLSHLSVHDSGVPPMTDAFNTSQASWTYSAFPAQILFNTTLPLLNKYVQNPDAIPQPTHDAAWWDAQTKGMDFSQEDRVPTERFNRIIWQGLMGNKPYPSTRSGAELRRGGTPQPETRQFEGKTGSK
jgi:hypothetical protein